MTTMDETTERPPAPNGNKRGDDDTSNPEELNNSKKKPRSVEDEKPVEANQEPKPSTFYAILHYRPTIAAKAPSKTPFNGKPHDVDENFIIPRFAFCPNSEPSKAKQSNQHAPNQPSAFFRHMIKFHQDRVRDEPSPTPSPDFSPTQSNTPDQPTVSKCFCPAILFDAPVPTNATLTTSPLATTTTINVTNHLPDLSIIAKPLRSAGGSAPFSLVDCSMHPFSLTIPLCFKHNPPDLYTPAHCLRPDNFTNSTSFKDHPPDSVNIDYITAQFIESAINNQGCTPEPPDHQEHDITTMN